MGEILTQDEINELYEAINNEYVDIEEIDRKEIPKSYNIKTYFFGNKILYCSKKKVRDRYSNSEFKKAILAYFENKKIAVIYVDCDLSHYRVDKIKSIYVLTLFHQKSVFR